MLPDIHRRIVNAKYVLERAASMQAEKNEMSLSISLLLMHDAIELLMLAVLDHLQIPVKNRREFMDFWGDIKQANLPEVPDRIPMESLNKLRVGLKHNGNLPNPQSVRDLLPRARGFFENVLSAYCQMAYADVSLLDLIADAEVRDILKGAHHKFDQGDKADAMTDLKIAMHKLEHPEGKQLPKMYAPKKPSIPSELQRAGWGRYFEQLHFFMAECAGRTNALMFGVDPIRYAVFMRSGPSISWSWAGTSQVVHMGTYDHVNSEQFQEFLSFLIDYALKISDSYIPVAFRRPVL